MKTAGFISVGTVIIPIATAMRALILFGTDALWLGARHYCASPFPEPATKVGT